MWGAHAARRIYGQCHGIRAFSAGVQNSTATVPLPTRVRSEFAFNARAFERCVRAVRCGLRHRAPAKR